VQVSCKRPRDRVACRRTERMRMAANPPGSPTRARRRAPSLPKHRARSFATGGADP